MRAEFLTVAGSFSKVSNAFAPSVRNVIWLAPVSAAFREIPDAMNQKRPITA
jgi:hypothetical protein